MKRSIVLNSTLAVATVALGFAGYSAMGTKAAAKVTSSVFEAKKGIVLSAVTASGNVQVPGQVDASFDSAVTSNKVTEILVKVGDKATVGQPLAKVNDASLQTALASAQAAWTSTKASTDKVKAGLTVDDKTQLQSGATQAKVSLNSAQASLDNARTNADINGGNYDEAIHQANVSLDTAKAQSDRDLTTAQLSVQQAQAAADKEAPIYAAAQTAAATDETNRVPCDTAGGVPLDGATCAVAGTRAANSKTALAKEETTQTQVVNALANAKNSQESTKLKAAQSVTSATNALTNSENNQTSGLAKDTQAIDSAARQLETARAGYASTLAANDLKLKSPTEADLAAANASLLKADTDLATARKNLELSTLLAPAAGTIASISGKIGASPGGNSSSASGSGASSSSSSSSSAFMVITDLSVLEVKAGFSEADAAKVKVDQGVTVTLDALAGKVLGGKVRAIDTVSTLVSNVVTYYVYVTVEGSDPAAKPGMTSSLSVVVDKAEDVVTLPSSAVTARGNAASVKVQTGATTKDVEVRNITLGLKGDTLIEIKTGLVAGDKVIVTRGGTTTTGSGTLTGGGGAVPGGAGGAGQGGAGGARGGAGG